MIGAMDIVRWLIAIVLVALPILWWFWRESRDLDPSVLWAGLAGNLGLAYAKDPHTLKGAWKGREVSLIIENGRPVASARYSSGSRVRLEIGRREQLEREAGMVVPDRVEFVEDRAFSEAMLVRASSEDFGRLLVDPSLRRRLLSLDGAHLLASGGRVDLSVAQLRREEQFREVFDIAVSVADAAEHA